MAAEALAHRRQHRGPFVRSVASCEALRDVAAHPTEADDADIHLEEAYHAYKGQATR